jgi:ATP-dependent exoDNAse (exonuclease V) beta subunit
MTLRPKQQAAVEREGQDVCVVAGPGSGKTRVLVERFGWLVRERKVSPLRILAITFTEKAATEIKRRLAGEFADDTGLREQVERAYVSTIHGLCSRLLRDYPIAAGVDPGFAVLDGPASERELEQAAHETLDQKRFWPLIEAIYASTWPGGRQADLAEAVIKVYQAMRSYGKSVAAVREESAKETAGLTLADFIGELRGLLATAPAERTAKQAERIDNLLEWCESAPAAADRFQLLSEYPRGLPAKMLSPDLRLIRDERLPLVASTLAGQYFAPLKTLLLDAVELTGQKYSRRKMELASLDFSDLEEKAIELLRAGPGVLASVRRRFEYVLMDEVQDTNPLQWTLVNLLRTPGRFFAVGDVNQSIYGFRHAEPGVFEEYQRSVAAAGNEVDELDENHRSRAGILAAAEAVLGGQPGIRPPHLSALREFGPKDDPSVEAIVGAGADPVSMEAQWIARRIRELAGSLMVQDGPGRQRTASFRDIAILVRKTNALAAIIEALQNQGVPFLHEGGKSFYEAREVRDLVHLLRVVADPADEVSMAAVLRSPLAGLSDETLLRLKLNGGAPLPDPEDEASRRRFDALLGRLRAQRDDVSPDRLLLRAMDECDYEGGLDSGARANVDKLLALLRDWYRSRPRPLDKMAEDLEWLRESASEAEAPPEEASDAVRVMSIHQAKGLEFPIVFVAALDRGVSNALAPICLSREGGLGVCWRNPADGTQVRDLIHLTHCDEIKSRSEDEENRLLYVAMTRAEEHLVLSYAETERKRGNHWRLVAEGVDAGPIELTRAVEPPEVMDRPVTAETRSGEPIVLARPALAGQYDSTVQVTALNLFAQCPRRYYLGRYIGREGPPSQERSGRPNAAEFGNLVHAMLAGQPRPEAPAEALDLVERFHSSALGRRAAGAQRAEREFDFVMALEDVVLRGQIDLWLEEGGELVLVDYKTDSVAAEEAEGRAAQYALQLRLYALALERLTGRLPGQALVCFLRPGLAVPVALDAALLEEARAVVRALKEAQSTLRFELREGEQCRRCAFYRGLCPAAIFFSTAAMSLDFKDSGSGSGSRPL